MSEISALSFAGGLLLLVQRPVPGRYLLVDDLNLVFILLGSFVGLTTSLFSASYIGHELTTGRLTPGCRIRFYHAMFQVMMFGMNLALVSNNIGLMWVAVELATLSTVVMVGVYRTHAALEAAWKDFILGSVGIALALFVTILVYSAARPVVGGGTERHGLDRAACPCKRLRPGVVRRRLHIPVAGVRDQGRPGADAFLAPRCPCPGTGARFRADVRTAAAVAMYAILRFQCCGWPSPRVAPGPLMITFGLVSLLLPP